MNNHSIPTTAQYKGDRCRVCILKDTKQWELKIGTLWKMTMWLKQISLSVKGLLTRLMLKTAH